MNPTHPEWLTSRRVEAIVSHSPQTYINELTELLYQLGASLTLDEDLSTSQFSPTQWRVRRLRDQVAELGTLLDVDREDLPMSGGNFIPCLGRCGVIARPGYPGLTYICPECQKKNVVGYCSRHGKFILACTAEGCEVKT